jgi:hypothetical protein
MVAGSLVASGPSMLYMQRPFPFPPSPTIRNSPQADPELEFFIPDHFSFYYSAVDLRRDEIRRALTTRCFKKGAPTIPCRK